jgi:hypothetical protein
METEAEIEEAFDRYLIQQENNSLWEQVLEYHNVVEHFLVGDNPDDLVKRVAELRLEIEHLKYPFRMIPGGMATAAVNSMLVADAKAIRDQRADIAALFEVMQNFGGYARTVLIVNQPEWMEMFWERFKEFEDVYDQMTEKYKVIKIDEISVSE